jgi:hypothetical protein
VIMTAAVLKSPAELSEAVSVLAKDFGALHRRTFDVFPVRNFEF